MKTLDTLDTALADAIEYLKSTRFYTELCAGHNTRAIYARYLQYAYHYVRLSSSFTPLAARRMDEQHIKTRKWILSHSGEELGHELMALKDLEKLGFERDAIIHSEIPVGVMAWVSFFHYKVAIDNPFCAFGILYFLEGMAREIAPQVLPGIITNLSAAEKSAITFFREHGDLDEDHMAEQREILLHTNTTAADEKAIADTITQAAKIKGFMLDQLMLELPTLEAENN